jgi:hypothetical protein
VKRVIPYAGDFYLFRPKPDVRQRDLYLSSPAGRTIEHMIGHACAFVAHSFENPSAYL